MLRKIRNFGPIDKVRGKVLIQEQSLIFEFTKVKSLRVQIKNCEYIIADRA